MATKRHQKYSLDETFEDVKTNIEGSLISDTSNVKVEPIISDSPVESPTLSVSEKPEVERKKSSPIGKKKKVKKIDTPFIDEDTTVKTNVRNVELDDETLWRLDQVKDRLNRSRAEGEPLMTQKTIMSKALIEWLDKYYPNTKEAYHFINNLD